MGAFRTEWDTEANPRYDVWTTTNGGEILPGVLAIRPRCTTHGPPVADRADETYPTGKRVHLFKPPIGNFFGITAAA